MGRKNKSGGAGRGEDGNKAAESNAAPNGEGSNPGDRGGNYSAPRPRKESGGSGDGWQQNSGNHSKRFSEDNQQKSRGPQQFIDRQKPYNSQHAPRRFQQEQEKSPGQNAGLEYKRRVEKQWQPDARENLGSANKRGPKRERGAPVNLNREPRAGVINQLQHSLQENRVLEKPSLQHVINKSRDFWEEFPSETARLHVLLRRGVPESKLESFVHSVYPIVHHSCLNLMNDFLEFKRAKGSSVERALYKNMTLLSFVDRLLKQRPLAFLGSNDRYLLPNLQKGSEGFEAIGTDHERPPLLLENYLSYDEMRISALVSLSSWSVFVNNGRRKNFGELDKAGTFQEDGVIVGQVGARLKREGVMDYLDCVVMRTENIPDKGFGSNNQWHVNSVFDKLWGKPLPTFEEANRAFLAQRDGNPIPGEFEIIPIGREMFFNVTVYKQRIIIPAETLLCEANSRAKMAGKKAYVHVVGLGLGVWRASDKQEEIFVEAWGDALKNIANTDHIAHIDFSYINSHAVHDVKDGEIFPNTNITIHFSKRDLHDKVPTDCILVCSYAWDGNSLPGNEFWMGKMCSTGDSAAACSSCVAEIHNHLFNPLVSGDTLRVATRDGYLLSWQDYLAQSTGAAPKPPPAAAAPPSRHPPVVAPSSAPVTTLLSPAAQPAPKPDHFDNPDPPFVLNKAALSVNVNLSPAASQPQPSVTETMEMEPNDSDARSSVSMNVLVDTSLSTSVESDTVSTPPVPVCKKPRQSNEACAEVAAEEVEVKEPDVPKQIPHPTIPGLTIENPAYKKTKKAPKKEKGPKPQGDSSQSTGNTNQSQSSQKSDGNSKTNAGNPSKTSGGGGGGGKDKSNKGKGGGKDAKSPKSTNKGDGEWIQQGGKQGSNKKKGKK